VIPQFSSCPTMITSFHYPLSLQAAEPLGEEVLYVSAKYLEDLFYLIHQRPELLSFDLEGVGMAEEVAEPEVGLEGLSRLAPEDGGANVGHLSGHPP